MNAAFAADLEAQLPAAAASKTSTSITQELEKLIDSFPLSVTTSSRCEELDRSGTAIWNLCTRLRRNYDTNNPQEVPIVLLLARVYAFLMVDCAHVSGKITRGNLARMIKTGLKAGKSCLGEYSRAYRPSKLTIPRVQAISACLKSPWESQRIRSAHWHLLGGNENGRKGGLRTIGGRILCPKDRSGTATSDEYKKQSNGDLGME